MGFGVCGDRCVTGRNIRPPCALVEPLRGHDRSPRFPPACLLPRKAPPPETAGIVSHEAPPLRRPNRPPSNALCLGRRTLHTPAGGVYIAEEVVPTQEQLEKEQMTPEDFGEKAAKLLLEQILRGGCVDGQHQALTLLFMALGPEQLSRVRSCVWLRYICGERLSAAQTLGT